MGEYRVRTQRPLNKVVNGGVAGAIVVFLAWGLHQFAGIDLPDEVAGAITVMAYAVVAWYTPIAPGEITRE